MNKEEIVKSLNKVEDKLLKMEQAQGKFVSVTEYKNLTYTAKNGEVVWSDALQQAIRENQFVYIPKSERPYFIDKTIIVPSNRNIKADKDALIKQMENVKVLMLRNENTVNGTHYMPDGSGRDCNISICGGRWEETRSCKGGYGKSGMYDENRSYYGVSASILFNNVENLSLRNMTFVRAGGFAIQLGAISNALIESMEFIQCYADGVHINGNTSNIIVRNIKGQVGDDLVALNMYDWQNSSVNFGPLNCALCENIMPYDDGAYKAMRIEPGIYHFDDGSEVDCSVNDLVVRKVKGIDTFKLYFQTPAHKLGTQPERGEVGSGKNIYFEDIQMDLKFPADRLEPYMNSDPIRGVFAAFEFGANINNVHLDNITVRMYQDKYPISFFACVGPKSVVTDEGMEIFDPDLSSLVDGVYYSNIVINGEKINDITPYMKEISFDDINHDGKSSGKGRFRNIKNKDVIPGLT